MAHPNPPTCVDLLDEAMRVSSAYKAVSDLLLHACRCDIRQENLHQVKPTHLLNLLDILNEQLDACLEGAVATQQQSHVKAC